MNHIAKTKPIVPQTRIGGNFRMKFRPCCSSTRKEMVLFSAMVGMKTIAFSSMMKYSVS